MPSTITGKSSMAYDLGDVVFVPFPFRDKLAESVRPAIIISGMQFNQQGDVVVAAITSKPPRFASDYALQDWAQAGLKVASTVRMLLATIAQTRIVYHLGKLSGQDLQEVQTRLTAVF